MRLSLQIVLHVTKRAISALHQLPVMAVMRQTITQPRRITQQRDSQPTVPLVTAKPHGNQVHLTMMPNISLFIVAHIKTRGQNVMNVTLPPEISAHLIV
jgi:hypothetical protein